MIISRVELIVKIARDGGYSDPKGRHKKGNILPSGVRVHSMKESEVRTSTPITGIGRIGIRVRIANKRV